MLVFKINSMNEIEIVSNKNVNIRFPSKKMRSHVTPLDIVRFAIDKRPMRARIMVNVVC